jgi:GINS complex subunit 2
MSAMEVNIIRAFAGRALQAFYKHDNEQQATDTDRMLDKQPQIPTDRPKVCYFLMSDLHVCEVSSTCRIHQSPSMFTSIQRFWVEFISGS